MMGYAEFGIAHLEKFEKVANRLGIRYTSYYVTKEEENDGIYLLGTGNVSDHLFIYWMGYGSGSGSNQRAKVL